MWSRVLSTDNKSLVSDYHVKTCKSRISGGGGGGELICTAIHKLHCDLEGNLDVLK